MRCNDISVNSERFISECGSPLHPVYHTKIDKKGDIELEITGYENIQDKIEAERPGCELRTLIARYENGDLLALNSRAGFYGDVAHFPASLIDAMNIVRDAEIEFEKLPVDVKNKYGVDWRKWLADFGSDEWMKSMKIFEDVGQNKEKESVSNADPEK